VHSVAPSPEVLARVLDSCAPLRAAPLTPELRCYHARSLVEVWETAEREAGTVLPAPFWAYPWAAGAALARVLLDEPERVRGRRVLDIGAGGGITSIAAARAGAARVVANDIDAWALATAARAAAANEVAIDTLLADLTLQPAFVDAFDVVLAGDLAYEHREAPRQLALLRHAARNGALVLAADAGRTYFKSERMTLLATFRIPVPRDLEGVTERVARVYAVHSDVEYVDQQPRRRTAS
jgi:predicted nicotinamide N-methyase